MLIIATIVALAGSIETNVLFCLVAEEQVELLCYQGAVAGQDAGVALSSNMTHVTTLTYDHELWVV